MSLTQTLIDALRAGDLATADMLITDQLDAARGTGDGGQSPVLEALYHGHTEFAFRIARHRETDLIEAAALGDEPRVRSLLERNASAVANRSPDGWTPLHLAAFFGRTAAASALIEKGADLEARSANYMANTPLCAAIAGATNVETIALLLESGADVNANTGSGVRPIHLAAARGAEAVTRDLLSRGARVDVAMEDGKTPAQMAAERGHPEVASLLAGLERGGERPLGTVEH